MNRQFYIVVSGVICREHLAQVNHNERKKQGTRDLESRNESQFQTFRFVVFWRIPDFGFLFFGVLTVCFFWIFGCSLTNYKGSVQKNKNPKIQSSTNPKNQKSKKNKNPKFGNTHFGAHPNWTAQIPKFVFFWIFGPPKLWIFGFLAASRNFQAQGRKFKIAGIHSEATAKAGTIWPSTEACTLTDIATLGLGRPGGPAKPQGCKVCRSPGLSAWTFCPSCGCGF